MSLIELQRDIRAWLIKEDQWAAQRIGPDAAPGLRIYQNNYRAQLIACLDESFAHTRDWLGHDVFHQAMAAHIDRVPPSSWTLDAYTRDVPETLAAMYPHDPEIAELAWLDRALGDAFVGADAQPLSTTVLSEVDWDRAVLHFGPTLDLIDATTNAAAIWAALAAGEVPPAVELLSEPGALLVWRHDLVSRFRMIDGDEQQAILLARSGVSFAELCTSLVAAHGETDGVAMAGALLGRWLADGLITDITEGDETCASPQS
ncbi:DUF2063 domain-containing protein [Sphingomonas panacisoli]|uniref:DUF2063 domain-containing protein n=1 Tax=Sphingomonas panacisoli TaxID=1813879 RepID=A0A5B8LJN2_9SPHN|nr:DNA-binding domain-containing protein [Sphingomonas panacisoli]QDZ08089.1 DUF2063 domain-containing protein [Sphingomonas panacisoli]